LTGRMSDSPTPPRSWSTGGNTNTRNFSSAARSDTRRMNELSALGTAINTASAWYLAATSSRSLDATLDPHAAQAQIALVGIVVEQRHRQIRRIARAAQRAQHLLAALAGADHHHPLQMLRRSGGCDARCAGATSSEP
jgi:K+-transporting ATPase c subunit